MTITQHARLPDVDSHLDRVRECYRDWQGKPLPTATPDGERYPLVYPRDTAVICRAFERLGNLDAAPEDDVTDALAGAAWFFIDVQDGDGTWAQRYGMDGKDRSIYPQEDNTAHAVDVIARHVLHERARGRASEREEDAMRAVLRGLRASRDQWFRDEPGLYRSTTSVHESAMERGFTLWVNGAYREALRLATEALRETGRDDDAREWSKAFDDLGDSIARHLVRDGTFVRAVRDDGTVDERADVTLLSPSYYRFEDLAPDAEEAGVTRLEDALTDPDLGLLRRYDGDRDELEVHLHGGRGPYLSFSSWLGQRHARLGDPDRARGIVRRIIRCATRDGALPEHVATMREFDAFMREEWETGLDFRKEFDEDVLLPGVGYADVLEEAARMTKAYAHAVRAAERAGDGLIRLAAPHAWTHADVALATAMVERGR